MTDAQIMRMEKRERMTIVTPPSGRLVLIQESQHFHIRPATAADIPALAELEQSSFPGDRISAASWRRLVRPGSHAVLVATYSGGGIRGCAVILFRKGSRTARLYSIAVDGDARGGGLGSLLLAESEALARNRDCDRMVLEVRTDAEALVAWYGRHGYRRFDTRPGYYQDGADAIRMTRSIENAAETAEAATR